MKIKPRIDLENRTKLQTVLPLSTPFIINIDPSDTCNFQCKFCPTGDRELMKNTVGRNKGSIDFNLYKKIIKDIKEFDKPIKVIRLYKDGEPFMNSKIVDMISYAKDSGCCERIDTTTNGTFLNPLINKAIIKAGLTRINISIEGINSKQYKDFSNYSLNFEKLVNNIRDLYENKENCEIIIKINGDIISEEDKNIFYKIFGDIADGVFIEHTISCWPNFAMNGIEPNKNNGIYGQQIKEVMVCPYPFYSMYINSDGSVSLCFLDWNRSLIIGDTKNTSLKTIWNSNKLLNYKKMFLKKERKSHPFCSNCQQLSCGSPDDIDSFSNEILEKYESLSYM